MMDDVREIRSRFNFGVMDCKEALLDSGGGVEAAIELLHARAARRSEMKTCAHCGEQFRHGASLTTPEGHWDLCHPDEGLDCYHLVTVWREPVGSRIGWDGEVRSNGLPAGLADEASDWPMRFWIGAAPSPV